MNIIRFMFAFSGTVILLNILLSNLHYPAWMWLTVFVVANLLHAAFTGFYPY